MRHAALTLIGLFTFLAPTQVAARPHYRVDRVVMLIRHGVRAPLAGEAAAAPLATSPFPRWETPASLLTPHGAAALRLFGDAARTRLVRQGLLPRSRCPAPGKVSIWTNSVARTIASGRALAEGLAPGCLIPIDHLAEGHVDPLFDAIEAGAVPFDAVAAAASINAEMDGGRTLMHGADRGFATMARVLGCDRAAPRCDFAAMANRIIPAPDGKGIELSGAIDLTSGTAQVFLLQYAEGLPMAGVGWGRASPDDIAAMSTLHARLFDVFARSRYMAPRVGGPIAHRIATALTDRSGPKVRIFVGHDNTIAAITALLGAHFQIPGYGRDDPPIGGGLVIERLRDLRSGNINVRLLYQAQTPGQVRSLGKNIRFQIALRRIPMAACRKPCGLATFSRVLDYSYKSTP